MDKSSYCLSNSQIPNSHHANFLQVPLQNNFPALKLLNKMSQHKSCTQLYNEMKKKFSVVLPGYIRSKQISEKFSWCIKFDPDEDPENYKVCDPFNFKVTIVNWKYLKPNFFWWIVHWEKKNGSKNGIFKTGHSTR